MELVVGAVVAGMRLARSGEEWGLKRSWAGVESARGVSAKLCGRFLSAERLSNGIGGTAAAAAGGNMPPPPFLAKALSSSEPSFAVKGLQDFTDYPFITIDKIGTNHREDAIYIEELEGVNEYFVVIAFADQNRGETMHKLSECNEESISALFQIGEYNILNSFRAGMATRSLFIALHLQYDGEAKIREIGIHEVGNTPFPYRIKESWIGEAFVMPFINLFYSGEHKYKDNLYYDIEGQKVLISNVYLTTLTLMKKMYIETFDFMKSLNRDFNKRVHSFGSKGNLDQRTLVEVMKGFHSRNKYNVMVNFLMMITKKQTANLLGVKGGVADEGESEGKDEVGVKVRSLSDNMKVGITQKAVRDKIKELQAIIISNPNSGLHG
jgi:hypothetical protein